jgi:hypothetical protein
MQSTYSNQDTTRSFDIPKCLDKMTVRFKPPRFESRAFLVTNSKKKRLMIMMQALVSFLFLLLALVQSQVVEPFEVTSIAISEIPSIQPVSVACVFDNAWTAATHPADYPSSNAHWSPMVVASHSSEYEMWSPAQLASPGVQSVAEVRSRDACFILLFLWRHE